MFACSGGGPVLGGRSRGVGQSRAAATQNETPGGMSEDLGWTVLCREYRALRRLSFLMICWLCVYTISTKNSVKKAFPSATVIRFVTCLWCGIKTGLFLGSRSFEWNRILLLDLSLCWNKDFDEPSKSFCAAFVWSVCAINVCLFCLTADNTTIHGPPFFCFSACAVVKGAILLSENSIRTVTKIKLPHQSNKNALSPVSMNDMTVFPTNGDCISAGSSTQT